MKIEFKNAKHKRNYLNKMKRINNLKRYHLKLENGSKKNNEEIISNIKRMFAKGLITQAEQYQKLKKYE